METKYLEKLEFYKIIEMLTDNCCTYKGRELSNELIPSNNRDAVENLIQETYEACNLVYRNSMPSFYEINNISIELKKLESGNSLSISSLLAVTNIFKLAQELKDYFNKDFLDLSDYPILEELFSKLYSNKSVTDRVYYCIIDEDTIDDRASKELQNIRKQKRKLEQDIRSKLNDMIHSSKFSKYIQESIITIRNNRFVIPIKEEARSQINGFVHDVSNAGATVFIEPISVFEMNNELNKLKMEEEIEIEKILYDLSRIVLPLYK